MNTFIALDVETANSYRRSICSIGLVKFVDGQLVDSYYTLINPEEDFYWRNIRIHGLAENDVKTSPTFKEEYQNLISFIGELPIVAHNASFDKSSFDKACEKYNLAKLGNNWYCSRNSAKRALPNIFNYSLEYLSDYFNIELNHHHALSDATASGLIWLKLLERFEIARAETIFSQNENHLDGKHFCFSGTLENFTKNEVMEFVTQSGGIAQKNVTKQTDFLVVGNFRPQDLKNGGTGKLKKATELIQEGQLLEIISEKEFLDLFK